MKFKKKMCNSKRVFFKFSLPKNFKAVECFNLSWVARGRGLIWVNIRKRYLPLITLSLSLIFSQRFSKNLKSIR